MKITIKNEHRTIIENYLKAKARAKEAAEAERQAKAQAKEVFTTLGKSYKEAGCTDYLYGTIQESGKARGIVYKETTRKGAIDWEAYAKALGGNDADAETYRKADTHATSIDYATVKQEKELGL